MRILLLVIIAALAVGGCSSIDSRKKSSTFETAVFHYSKAIRWSEFGLADGMRRLEPGAHAAQSPEQLEHIKVTSYETISTNNVSDNEVRVTVRIVYYHDDGMKLNTLLDNQIWIYDTDRSTWHITTPLPLFR
ncbi:MAG: hypothetical protein R3F42_09115 [Pseudomonadota bacterium]